MPHEGNGPKVLFLVASAMLTSVWFFSSNHKTWLLLMPPLCIYVTGRLFLLAKANFLIGALQSSSQQRPSRGGTLVLMSE